MERSKHIRFHVANVCFWHTHQPLFVHWLAVHVNIKQTLHSFALVYFCLLFGSLPLFVLCVMFSLLRETIIDRIRVGNGRQSNVHTEIYLCVHKTETLWFCTMIYEPMVLSLYYFASPTKALAHTRTKRDKGRERRKRQIIHLTKLISFVEWLQRTMFEIIRFVYLWMPFDIACGRCQTEWNPYFPILCTNGILFVSHRIDAATISVSFIEIKATEFIIRPHSDRIDLDSLNSIRNDVIPIQSSVWVWFSAVIPRNLCECEQNERNRKSVRKEHICFKWKVQKMIVNIALNVGNRILLMLCICFEVIRHP